MKPGREKLIDDAIGQRLSLARQVRGYSQTQVAKLMNFSPPTIAAIEAGARSLRACEIQFYASLYGVNPVWILCGDNREDNCIDADLLKRLTMLTPFERQVVIRKLVAMGD